VFVSSIGGGEKLPLLRCRCYCLLLVSPAFVHALRQTRLSLLLRASIFFANDVMLWIRMINRACCRTSLSFENTSLWSTTKSSKREKAGLLFLPPMLLLLLLPCAAQYNSSQGY
jgi:hypothetical protein